MMVNIPTKFKLLGFRGNYEKILQTKIYRYVELDTLFNMVAHSVNQLSRPLSWDKHDPYENVFFKIPHNDFQEGKRTHYSKLTEHFYAQCWTSRIESDSQWQIYQSRYQKSGVIKIQSTIKKLLLSHPEGFSKYVGKVRYFTKNKIIKERHNLIKNIESILLSDGGTGKKIADYLLIKRSPYFAEKEVRFLVAASDVKSLKEIPDSVCYKIDPNQLIDKMVFDPRMPKNEYYIHKAKLQRLGFKNSIIRSRLYDLDVSEFTK